MKSHKTKRKTRTGSIWLGAIAVVLALFLIAVFLKKGESNRHNHDIKEPVSNELQEAKPEDVSQEGLDLHPFFAEARGAATKEGYYYIEDTAEGQFVAYVDYATQKQIPLCPSPNCTHNDESCQAYLPGRSGSLQLTQWNGKLYLFNFPGGQEDAGGVQEMNLDGSNRHYIHKFHSGDLWNMNWQLATDDAIYINFFTEAETQGYKERTPRTFVYHLGDKEAVEAETPMLQTQDVVLDTVGDQVLIFRYNNETQTSQKLLVRTDGTSKPWSAPEGVQLDISSVSNKTVFRENKDHHLEGISLIDGSVTDYGKLPFDGDWSVCAARDGNVVVSGPDTENGEHTYYLCTDKGITKSQFSYYRHETLRCGLLEADVDSEHYLITSNCDTPNREFQMISKADYWMDKDAGIKMTAAW